MSVFKAAANGCVSTIISLVKRGDDVNTPDAWGTSPISAAVRLGHVNAVKTLLNFGADYESTDSDGNSPACTAIWEGNLGIAELLVDAGANINAPGTRGWTPMMIAAQKSWSEAMERLVILGADINAVGTNGETALDLASGAMDMVTAVSLVNFGADISSYMQAIAPAADIHDMFAIFCQSCLAPQCARTYPLFSFTKLLRSVQICSTCRDADDESREVEIAIACALRQIIDENTIKNLYELSYDIRRRVVQLAESVFNDSLRSVSYAEDALSSTGSASHAVMSTKARARRYVELVCFLFDKEMLRGVLALRLTCRAVLELRRFPVCCTRQYCELPGHLIESFFAYDASRLVSAQFIQGMIEVHMKF